MSALSVQGYDPLRDKTYQSTRCEELLNGAKPRSGDTIQEVST